MVTSTDQLIEQLSEELRPVQPLPPPGVRALLWLAVCGALCVGLILRFGHPAMYLHRFAVPRIAVETIATALTAIAATWAAFELSVPDRSPRWVWLPLPPFLLWLAASGLGCLQNGFSLGGAGGVSGRWAWGYSGGCAARARSIHCRWQPSARWPRRQAPRS
jgi:hypothetical protein